MGVRVQLQAKIFPQNFLAPFSSQAPILQIFFSLDQKINNLNRPSINYRIHIGQSPVTKDSLSNASTARFGSDRHISHSGENISHSEKVEPAWIN